MAEKLTPERAVRLLRAKAAEMESRVIRGSLNETGEPLDDLSYAIADIALVATLLADFMERFDEDVQTAKGMMDELHQSFREGRSDE